MVERGKIRATPRISIPVHAIVIVDGHPIHKAKLVRAYVDSLKGQLKLFYLPPYSPQLNPDEQVWAHVKRHVSKRLAGQRRNEAAGAGRAASDSTTAEPHQIVLPSARVPVRAYPTLLSIKLVSLAENQHQYWIS
jgi:hypothetical protein